MGKSMFRKFMMGMFAVLSLSAIVMCMDITIAAADETQKNGLYHEEDGWNYYRNGEIASDTTTLVKYNGSWWYVENGKITSSELAAKTKTLPPAVSRTLRGLEEKGYVERNVDKKDRRNTYISLTEKGWKKGEEVRDRMQDFGCSVMSQLKEEDIDQLVAYLDRIYEIAEKEIDTRKRQN